MTVNFLKFNAIEINDFAGNKKLKKHLITHHISIFGYKDKFCIFPHQDHEKMTRERLELENALHDIQTQLEQAKQVSNWY